MCDFVLAGLLVAELEGRVTFLIFEAANGTTALKTLADSKLPKNNVYLAFLPTHSGRTRATDSALLSNNGAGGNSAEGFWRPIAQISRLLRVRRPVKYCIRRPPEIQLRPGHRPGHGEGPGEARKVWDNTFREWF